MSKGKFEFKVNGDEFTTEKPNPTASEILEIAKRACAYTEYCGRR